MPDTAQLAVIESDIAILESDLDAVCDDANDFTQLKEDIEDLLSDLFQAREECIDEIGGTAAMEVRAKEKIIEGYRLPNVRSGARIALAVCDRILSRIDSRRAKLRVVSALLGVMASSHRDQ